MCDEENDFNNNELLYIIYHRFLPTQASVAMVYLLERHGHSGMQYVSIWRNGGLSGSGSDSNEACLLYSLSSSNPLLSLLPSHGPSNSSYPALFGLLNLQKDGNSFKRVYLIALDFFFSNFYRFRNHMFSQLKLRAV